jgi:hypothetical protein
LEGLNREYEEKFGGLRYVYVPFSLLFDGSEASECCS